MRLFRGILVTFSNLRAQQISSPDYFSMQRVTSPKVSLSLIVYSSKSQKNVLKCPAFFLSFKGNIIWTCGVGLVISLSVVFMSFAKKVAIDFCNFFSQLLGILSSLKL